MTPGNVERKLYRTQNISIRYRQNIPTPETDSYRTEMQDQFICHRCGRLVSKRYTARVNIAHWSLCGKTTVNVSEDNEAFRKLVLQTIVLTLYKNTITIGQFPQYNESVHKFM